MQIEVEGVVPLRFADGAPVRAASAVVPFDAGWLVVQDDATHAAWVSHPDGRAPVRRVRVLPAVEGHDTFEESAGTKRLKPDLEAAFSVPGTADVVLLGSGSSPARMRACRLGRASCGDAPDVAVADLAPLYAAVAHALGEPEDRVNLEGACVLGGTVRWFQRGSPAAGVPTAAVDVRLDTLLRVLAGDVDPGAVRFEAVHRYDLGEARGVGLAVTDAVTLADGRVLVSAAAEDTPDPREDGPVVGSVLAVLDDLAVEHTAPLPHVEGGVPKVEGLAIVSQDAPGDVRLLATLDADDATAPSLAVTLRARW
ncbi:DUF6910 family protein [Actinotalea solisilvae]|uniref:DUF6910 family protein n=1 Tax=Actinotalea solisilvae TaxID=2072922 RepID=UPI0018F1760B|nr:hypothetical protein [Actinotalea solisilvae]